MDLNVAAEYLGISKNTLYEWVIRQKVPHTKVWRKLTKFKREDLDAWLAKRTCQQRDRDFIQKILYFQALWPFLSLYHELSNLEAKAKGEHVFYSRYNEPFRDVKEGFLGAVKRAGIEDFRFHDLRHTFGSDLVMHGVSLRTVQRVMGHTDIKMTMRYSHFSPEYVQGAIDCPETVSTHTKPK
jgi:excisionase family DNA binding protein